MGHDTFVGGDNDNTELTGGKDGVDEVFEAADGEIETGGDNTALVQTTVELNNDFAGASIINNGEFVNVTTLLHQVKELNEGLGDGVEDNLYSNFWSLNRKFRAKASLFFLKQITKLMLS